MVETGVAQEPRPIQSASGVMIRGVIGIIGLDDDVAAVRPRPAGGLQLGCQQVVAPGLGPEQLALEAGDGLQVPRCHIPQSGGPAPCLHLRHLSRLRGQPWGQRTRLRAAGICTSAWRR